jgi:hypothetical protein
MNRYRPSRIPPRLVDAYELLAVTATDFDAVQDDDSLRQTSGQTTLASLRIRVANPERVVPRMHRHIY